MGIRYWDPLAGALAAHAMRMEMDAAARHADRVGLQRMRYRMAADMAAEPSARKAKKCPGCGSHTFAMTRGGRICSYCRTPEGDAA